MKPYSNRPFVDTPHTAHSLMGRYCQEYFSEELGRGTFRFPRETHKAQLAAERRRHKKGARQEAKRLIQTELSEV